MPALAIYAGHGACGARSLAAFKKTFAIVAVERQPGFRGNMTRLGVAPPIEPA
jgi:hypothetical protein